MIDSEVHMRLDPPGLHLPGTDALAAASVGGGLFIGTAGAMAGGAIAAMAVGAALGVSGFVTALAYPHIRHRLRDWSLRRRLGRIMRGEPSSLASARGRHAHVRGRVHVLDPIDLGDGKRLAVFVKRTRVVAHCACTPKCGQPFDALSTRWAVGRFAIVDDTGVAIVRSGVVDLWPTDGALIEGVRHELHHGDVVDISGPTGLADAPDAAHLAPVVSYRERAKILSFEGTEAKPVTILLPRGR